MRPTLVHLLAALVVLVGCTDDPAGPSAAVPTATAEASTLMMATGSGHILQDSEDPMSLRRFTISALGHADGSASGQYNLVVGPNELRVHGTVTCLNVVGNRAFIGGTLDRSTLAEVFPPELVDQITGVAIEVLDNGTGPMAAPDEVSSIGFFVAQPDGPQDWCDDAVSGGTMPIDRGSISVG